ncbi:MAG TPA: hypothetical protein VK980_14790 [Sphingomonas sp.]|nr:hypothetical protein [Sphingomonas sp.]
MFFIPGWLIELLTFPGVIVHEIGHRIFCHLTGVPVYQVRYYKFWGKPSGFVIHGPAPSLKAALLIAIGPLILNTLLCSLLTFSAVVPLFILRDSSTAFPDILLMWFGVSAGMHAFPSNHDMEGFTDFLLEAGHGDALVMVAQAFALLFKIANFLRVVWFDAIYAVLVAAFLPLMFGLF